MPGRNTTSAVYGVLDLVAAVTYVVLFTWIVPSRSALFTAVVWLASALFAAGGVGMLRGTRLGHRVAALASVVMLVACAALILLLVTSAAYLHGIYDGVGQLASAVALLAALLAIELVGLLPALQIAFIVRLRRQAEQDGC